MSARARVPDSPTARLAMSTLLGEPDRRVPGHFFNIMEHRHIERLAGASPGAYVRDPHGIYVAMVRALGTCSVDQYLAENPLTMGDAGFDGAAHGATTGAAQVTLDDIVIDSPEAVVSHLESRAFPALRAAAASVDEEGIARAVLAHEAALQERLGPGVLKIPYGHGSFPYLAYPAYGYTHYFAAYALYPEVVERHFALQADLALRHNAAVARAYAEGGLPPMLRLDHDMADSRGPLVGLRSLERIWFPHFDRCLDPLRRAGIRLVWHCDGNLMPMLPGLLDCGIGGFQGFQYEDGMDYPAICRMRTRGGEPLVIMAGVSVTRTLPYGTPSDVRRELAWLVENGPPTGLFLATSSSVTPGVPWENLAAFAQGLRHYQTVGRA
ncbi:MAG: hypothetical protein IT208_04935 [Chthonomonadales bacterium]|nr:hypothetical protein [Chthonomonadales bacterium]